MFHSGKAVVLRMVDQTTWAGASMWIEEFTVKVALSWGTFMVVKPPTPGQEGRGRVAILYTSGLKEMGYVGMVLLHVGVRRIASAPIDEKMPIFLRMAS